MVNTLKLYGICHNSNKPLQFLFVPGDEEVARNMIVDVFKKIPDDFRSQILLDTYYVCFGDFSLEHMGICSTEISDRNPCDSLLSFFEDGEENAE